jgi:hypothetical protein
VRRLLYIAYFLEVGLLLVLVPWSEFWDRNYFADAAPFLLTFLHNNFLRGGVSGLGIINLCIGFADLSTLLSSRRLDSRPTSVIVSANSPSTE